MREQDRHTQGFGVPGSGWLWLAQAQAMHNFNFPADGRDLRPRSEQGVLRHGAVGLPGERMVRRSGDEDITKCHYKHKHKHQ